MALTLKTAAATLPVTLAEAKDYGKFDDANDDTQITSQLTYATDWCQAFTGRAFVTQTWEWRLDAFPGSIFCVPYPLLQKVNSISYLDAADASQTLATSVYEVDTKSNPGRIALLNGQAWPTLGTKLNKITIDYDAGYGAAAAVPEPIKVAISMLALRGLGNREGWALDSGAPPPWEVQHRLRPYRLADAMI